MADIFFPLDIINARAAAFLENRLQRRTLRGYTRLVERYRTCCEYYHVEPFPPSENSFCLWMAHLTGTCCAASIANYLSGIGDFCRLNGIEYVSIRMSYRVTSSLNGIKLLFPHVTIRKSPILTHLQQLHQRINHADAEQTTFFAMATCCFFGLLRLGEVTLHEDNRRTLLLQHIGNITDRGCTLTLPASKTDPYWGSAEVYIPRITEAYCPIKALNRMLANRRVGSSFTLFENKFGTPFTRPAFLHYLHAFLPNDPLISGHSFRAGGATWAADLGLSELDICRLGRWSSQSYRKYLRAHPLFDYFMRNDPPNHIRR
jgi:hypothetical protein